MRRWIAPTAALALLLLLCPGGWAQSPTEELRGFFAAATRILEDAEPENKPEDRLSAIRVIVGQIFDFREAAQLSLGPDWNARTPAEREEFVRLFADLLERSFIAGVASRISLADGVQVSYLGESVDGGAATVRTTLASRSGLDLPFDYRMIERGDRWAVRDIVIDGVSIAANYRAQFVRVMQASSYPELIRQMQAKVSGAATETTWTSSTVAVRPVSAEPAAGLPSDDPVADARSADPPEPVVVPIARAEFAPAAIQERPRDDGAANKEPGPASPPSEPSLPSNHIQVVMAARPVGASPSSGRSYWVQVGAFKNPEAAKRFASMLREEGPPVSSRWAVTVAAGPAGMPLARVRVGPFPERAEAASKLRDLQARGYKPFIAEER